jgi:hypothetical protein
MRFKKQYLIFFASLLIFSLLHLQYLVVYSLSNYNTPSSPLQNTFRATANPNILVSVNGNRLSMSNYPILIVNGNTFAPLREIAIALGVVNDDRHIVWNGSYQTVMVKKENLNVEFQIYNRTAFINGSINTLGLPPFIYNGRTYVPLKFIAEAFSYQPVWNPSTQTIHIRRTETDEGTNNTPQESASNNNNERQQIVNEILSDDELRAFLANEVVDAFLGYSGYGSPGPSNSNSGSYIRGTYETTSGGYTSSGYLNYAGRYYYYYGGSQYEIDFYKRQLGGRWGLAPDGVTLYYNNVLYKLAR